MYKTEFKISKMDCPSEENLIRMKLGSFNINKLEFDLEERILSVYHEDTIDTIEKAIDELKLGSKKLSTTETEQPIIDEDAKKQRALLWTVLLINFVFFIIEILTGLVSKSMGLIADSMDMLADSSVYALSLFAVGGSVIRKKRIAKLAGYFQIALALVGFGEVIRRFIGMEQMPNFGMMIVVSLLALTANVICLFLLQKSKSEEAHMKASMIFTSNDVIINLGVILAGSLVFALNSNYPDLIIGGLVFIVVIRGSLRILKLST